MGGGVTLPTVPKRSTAYDIKSDPRLKKKKETEKKKVTHKNSMHAFMVHKKHVSTKTPYFLAMHQSNVTVVKCEDGPNHSGRGGAGM